ncbi:hypothetical protein [Pseudonocardia sp. ICBG601]|uniref:hypothetical protein n=1 Tax=Pseudonocardia sp. ICBG601 TaxID=2846759 RepID=UPI001CF6A9E0|nr:hypothetical protein [Pseudonocardia sp. ICBG601]
MTTTTSATSAPVGEVPALGLGREQSQAWVRLALTIATALRQHRLDRGRAAFSDQHAARRRGAQYAADLDPRVAAMAAADETAFRHAATTDATAAATAGFEELTSPEPQFGWTVHTTIGPIPAHAPSGGQDRWGLWAHGRRGDKELSVFVVVPDRDLATALRDELTHDQQRTLLQLRALGVYGCLRADHARTQVRPDDIQFTEHVRHALHTAWPDHPDLATTVLHTDTDSTDPDGANPDDRSLEGLHRRLRAFDDRGYHPADLLAVIDPNGIDRDRPRAALIAALDTLTPDTQQQPSTTPGATGQTVPRRGTDLPAAAQLLHRHLDPDTTTAVTGCRHWPGLARQLHTWHHDDTTTDYLAAELARVPTQRVRDARAPAIYLRSILDRSITFRRRHDTTARDTTVGDAVAGDDAADRQNTAAPTPTPTTTESTTTENTVDENPIDDQVPPTPFDIHQLDPTNALDRETLLASRGAGTAADDDYIDTILTADHPTELQHAGPDTDHDAAPTQGQHPECAPDQPKQENPANQVTAAQSTDTTSATGAGARTTGDTAQPAPQRPARFARKRQNTHTPRQRP